MADPSITSTLTGACVRCHVVYPMNEMVRLVDGRFVCRPCAAVLREIRRQSVAHKGGVHPGEADAPPRTDVGAETPAAAGDEIGLFREGAEALDSQALDTATCPSCGASVIFGAPTCPDCHIPLEDFWEDESVIHPLTPAQKLVRYGLRGGALLAIVGLALYLTSDWLLNRTEWSSWLERREQGAGRSLEEQALGLEIHPLITRRDRKLVIQNADNFPWSEVQVELNGAPGKPGFRTDIPIIHAEQSVERYLKNFRQPDGREFPAIGVPVTHVQVRVKMSQGVGLWSKGFIDATEDARVD